MNILDSVINEFSQIAKIPRPSMHESAVADYLIKKLKSLGLTAQKDEVGNVIAESYATTGYEDKPLIIMQAHMDMVCVSEPQYKYNPLTDEIKLKRDEEYLSAEGTSLGADDGIGIAIILHILSNQTEHGRQRIIFTIDEETGMTGASNLNAKHLDGAYLINVDSENADEIVTGSAGSLKVHMSTNISWTLPTKKSAYKIKIHGLKGGHSGESIHIKHANALKVMCKLIAELDCEIAQINGGRAMNVIPSECEAVIVTNREDVLDVCKQFENTIAAQYEEPALNIDVESLENLPDKVMNAADVESLQTVMSALINGVMIVSGSNASANIGVLHTTSSDKIEIEYMPRFHNLAGQNKMQQNIYASSQRSGYQVDSCESMPPWYSSKHELADKMIKLAARRGRKLTNRIIHGGLECSYFSVKNPHLEIVSIGTTNLDIHSPRERLLLSSVEPTVKLIFDTINLIYTEK